MTRRIWCFYRSELQFLSRSGCSWRSSAGFGTDVYHRSQTKRMVGWWISHRDSICPNNSKLIIHKKRVLVSTVSLEAVSLESITHEYDRFSAWVISYLRWRWKLFVTVTLMLLCYRNHDGWFVGVHSRSKLLTPNLNFHGWILCSSLGMSTSTHQRSFH
jgi:hypothetical protein